MEVDDVPLDDKAKRMRDLLSSFYSLDPSMSSPDTSSSSKYATLDAINTTSFDPDQYMHLLVRSLISHSLMFCKWRIHLFVYLIFKQTLLVYQMTDN